MRSQWPSSPVTVWDILHAWADMAIGLDIELKKSECGEGKEAFQVSWDDVRHVTVTLTLSRWQVDLSSNRR